MGLAARLLCRACRVILHTDLEWPPYVEVLRAEARRLDRKLVTVPARKILIEDHAGSGEFIDWLARVYRRSDADGLFLTEITYDGIRLPLARLVASLEASEMPRFVVVDASQALGHAPLDVNSGPGDLYLAGCHKWVGSGLPLSFAVAPKRRTSAYIRELTDALHWAQRLDDPLFKFTGCLSSGGPHGPGETVNLSPLFPASAAVSVQLGRADSAHHSFEQRLENNRVLALIARESGWEPIDTHPDHQSGILLIRDANHEARSIPPDWLRRLFSRHGVALTAYPSGVVRASLPEPAWTEPRLSAALAAFHGVRSELMARDSSVAGGSSGLISEPRHQLIGAFDGFT
jgi:hypothetical protein